MLHKVWTLLRDTVEGFVNDGAMSRGAAIAYYTIFSIAPLLVIATRDGPKRTRRAWGPAIRRRQPGRPSFVLVTGSDRTMRRRGGGRDAAQDVGAAEGYRRGLHR